MTEPYKSLCANAPKTGLILDVGCGNFTYTNFLKNFVGNAEIICIDAYKQYSAKSQRNTFLLSSADTLPFRSNSFNFIFCLSVLEFVKNHFAAITEFHRILRRRKTNSYCAY